MSILPPAEANYLAGMSRGVSGASNIASGTRVTINALVTMMSEASGISPQVEHGPARAGDVRHRRAPVVWVRIVVRPTETERIERAAIREVRAVIVDRL